MVVLWPALPVNNAATPAVGAVMPAATTRPAPRPSPKATTTPPATAKPAPATATPGSPTAPGGRALSAWRLFVDPVESSAKAQADAWRASRPADAARMDKLAAQPQSKWIGDWFPDPYAETDRYIGDAARVGALPVLTIYNLPGRDCGLYSSGGADNPAAYAAWTARVTAALGQRPAIIILEPDALAELDCYPAAQQAAIYPLLAGAIASLRHDANALIYLDAGDAHWQTPTVMAQRLQAAGLATAAGFAVNVSSFWTTAESLAYGNAIAALAGGKHFVIDTSRNGAGHDGTWCNPPGRALGQPPTLQTGQPLADGYLWIKVPGESDGDCDRGEPDPGTWWPDYALGLATRAGY